MEDSFSQERVKTEACSGLMRSLYIRVCNCFFFKFYFSIKTYILGTQKNHLNEMVLLSTQNIGLNLFLKKLLQFYNQNFCVIGSMLI